MITYHIIYIDIVGSLCDLIHELWVFVQSRYNRRAYSLHFSSSRVVVKPPQSGSPGIVETENLNGH